MGNRFPEETIYRSDPRDIVPTDANLSYRGYSNKRKEFDPNSPAFDPELGRQLRNPSFHPVAAPGRNGTRQLCKQLAVAFNIYESSINPTGMNGSCDADAAGALRNITIQCTDCHNNNTTGIGDAKGPVTGLPDGTSYRRITDIPSKISDLTSQDPAKPQGPHGSIYPRILRNQYNTDIEAPRDFFNDGMQPSHFENFLLCFQCHDRRAFDPFVGGDVGNPGENAWTNFVGVRSGVTIRDNWEGNLHKYHLKYAGAYCHECHYNVHSNVEATNTIYGDGSGGQLPPDAWDGISDGWSGTHLLNFAPGLVTRKNSDKPRWFFDASTSTVRCDLACHNVDMNSCVYQAPVGGNCAAGGCEFER